MNQVEKSINNSLDLEQKLIVTYSMTVVKIKKQKTKKCVKKRKLKFENYKNCLKATQPEN